MARARKSVIDRLMAKCVETNPPEGCQIASPCLTFTGWKNPSGHGQISQNGKLVYAHRVAFEAKHGPIPKGMSVMHLCDNPACCNPDHLTIGTHKENMHDAVLKGRHMGKNALPNLINRICLLRQSGYTPEEIAEETGYELARVLSLTDFLDDYDYLHEALLPIYGAERADRLRMDRLVYDQHTSAAISAMLAYEARAQAAKAAQAEQSRLPA